MLRQVSGLGEQWLEKLRTDIRDRKPVLAQEQIGTALALAELSHNSDSSRREQHLFHAWLGKDLRDRSVDVVKQTVGSS
ncbi:hypothetical protein A3862_04365 [Methylobacterium sp. XJLW]|nr:hypothetical protein A3862_04365 [Methylobacterium sp. XJLW]